MIGKRRKRPPKWIRDQVLAEQGNACFYCDTSFDEPVVIRRGKVCSNPIHWDHIIPFVFSGQNDDFVASCALCNLRKHDKIFEHLRDAKIYLKSKHHEDLRKEKTERRLRAMRANVHTAP